MKKRLFAVLLAMVMVLGLFPATALAADTSGTCGDNLTWTLDSDGVLTISGTGAMENYYWIGYDDDGNGQTTNPWGNGIQKVVIKDGVTSIGNSAFFGCVNLTSVTIPDGVTSIGNSAFRGCSNISSITIPDSVTSIGSFAFYYCEKLTSVTIPDGVTAIEDQTFFRAPLTSITIPSSVTRIGMRNFDSTLKDIYFGGSKEQWDSIESDSSNTLSATIHYTGEVSDPCANGHTWDSGKVTTEPTYTAEGVKTYTCTVCGETKTETLAKKAFVDVTSTAYSDWYYDAVLWAADSGITNGVSGTEFAPGLDCTRAQVVTFLWRAAGCPEPESGENPFVDVVETSYTEWYCDAVLWAVEQGITTGVDATHFAPNATCNRAMVAAFIWRANGKLQPDSAQSSFSDVTDSGLYYYDAVLWCCENGIINGMGDGTYAPMTTCNRAHVVTMLYRDAMR